MINKLRWIKNTMPDVYEEAHRFLQSRGFIAQRLTGNFATEWRDAFMCGYMAIKVRRRSEKIFGGRGSRSWAGQGSGSGMAARKLQHS